MLAPMREEATQTARDLNCQIPQLTVISEKEAAFLEAEKKKEEEKNKKPEVRIDSYFYSSVHRSYCFRSFCIPFRRFSEAHLVILICFVLSDRSY